MQEENMEKMGCHYQATKSEHSSFMKGSTWPCCLTASCCNFNYIISQYPVLCARWEPHHTQLMSLSNVSILSKVTFC